MAKGDFVLRSAASAQQAYQIFRLAAGLSLGQKLLRRTSPASPGACSRASCHLGICEDRNLFAIEDPHAFFRQLRPVFLARWSLYFNNSRRSLRSGASIGNSIPLRRIGGCRSESKSMSQYMTVRTALCSTHFCRAHLKASAGTAPNICWIKRILHTTHRATTVHPPLVIFLALKIHANLDRKRSVDSKNL